MALVRPSTPGNPGAHYVYEMDQDGVPGLMVDGVWYNYLRLQSLVHRALLTKEKLPWSKYVNRIVAKWVIAKI